MEEKNAAYYQEHLNLQPHPEGGFFRESYRAAENIPAISLPSRFQEGARSFSTAIYYLLERHDFSAFHKIKSDECWHYYAGGTLLIHVLAATGYSVVKLGNQVAEGEQLQWVVPAGAWFAAEPAPNTLFALVGCTVAPGFDFADFEMASKKELITQFSTHAAIIAKLCK